MRPICIKSLWHVERTEGFICCKDRERQISRAKNTEPSNIKYFFRNGSWKINCPMWCSPGRGKGGQGDVNSHHHRHPHILPIITPVVFTDIDPSIQNCLESTSLKSFEDMDTTNIPWHLCICTNTPCPSVFGNFPPGEKGGWKTPVVLAHAAMDTYSLHHWGPWSLHWGWPQLVSAIIAIWSHHCCAPPPPRAKATVFPSR